MKTVSISIFMIVLIGFAGSSFATSPQPEEVRLGQTDVVCTAHVVYFADLEKGTSAGESSSTVVFRASESKRDVLEKMTGHMSSKLNEGHVLEFKIECKFPKQ
jgi:hypothetical protein